MVLDSAVSNMPSGFIAELRERYGEHMAEWKRRNASSSSGITPAYVDSWSRCMSDDAPALVNAMRAVFGDNVEALMCWVHVWRAVMAKCASLGVKDDKTKRTLFTDLAFIHNLVNVDLVTHALVKFDVKWRTTLGLPAVANYVKAQWAKKKWQRAYGAPGEPSDNNTIEAINRVLKDDANFSRLHPIHRPRVAARSHCALSSLARHEAASPRARGAGQALGGRAEAGRLGALQARVQDE